MKNLERLSEASETYTNFLNKISQNIRIVEADLKRMAPLMYEKYYKTFTLSWNGERLLFKNGLTGETKPLIECKSHLRVVAYNELDNFIDSFLSSFGELK